MGIWQAILIFEHFVLHLCELEIGYRHHISAHNPFETDQSARKILPSSKQTRLVSSFLTDIDQSVNVVLSQNHVRQETHKTSLSRVSISLDERRVIRLHYARGSVLFRKGPPRLADVENVLIVIYYFCVAFGLSLLSY